MNNELERSDPNSPDWKAPDSLGEQSAKEQRWQQLSLEVEKVTDRLGKKIDSGIKETVVGLNVFEIPTTQSCEGHDNWGTGGPYIDVESPHNTDLNKRFQELIKKDDKSEAVENELDKVRKELKKNNLVERRKLITLLEEFYSDRKVSFETRLIIRSYAAGRSRLESQGVEFQEIEEHITQKQKKLELFQEEMKAFQDFLKSKFFAPE